MSGGGGFKKGQTAHGSKLRNVLTTAFLRDLLADYEQNGAGAIKLMRVEQPTKYCIMISTLLPRNLEIDITETKLDGMTDEQINELISNVERIIGSRINEAEKGSREDTERPKIH